MKPLFALLVTLLLASCVSYQLPGPVSSLPDGQLQLDTNQGGVARFWGGMDSRGWIFTAKEPFGRQGDRVVQVRQTRFEAVNKLDWGRDLLAKTAVYHVLWTGSVAYRGNTHDVKVSFRLRSRYETDRSLIRPTGVEDLLVTNGETVLIQAARLPAKLSPPFEFLTLEAGPRVISLKTLHAPLFQGQGLETREADLFSELSRTDLAFRVLENGEPLAVADAGKLMVTDLTSDPLVLEASVCHILAGIFTQLTKN